MRHLILLLSLITAVPVLAHDIRDVPDRELLDELARRLRTGGPHDRAFITSYSCDLVGDAHVGVLQDDGSEVKRQVQVGSIGNCTRQIAVLNNHRSRVRPPVIIVLCDVFGDLQRFSITRDGAVQDLTPQNIGSVSRCLNEADTINAS